MGSKRRFRYLRSRLVLIFVVAVLLCGSAFLVVVLEDGGRLLTPGWCSSTGFFGRGSGGGSGQVKELLENPNFEATSKAVRDLEAGIVDPRLVTALQTITEEHRICVEAFKEGHYFLPGVPDGPFIPASYGEAGGLPNTHYYGRAADIRRVDGKPVRGNGSDPDVLDVGVILADLPPQERPDQIIGPKSWAQALGRSRREGWILDEDQLRLHEGHLHVGYALEDSTRNTR